MSAFRGVSVLALALTALVPAWGCQEYPQGWKVETSSTIVAPKAGVYTFTVSVRDSEGRPVNDAQVSLRILPFGREPVRMVAARRYGAGRYWTTVALRRDYQLARNVVTVVTPASARE